MKKEPEALSGVYDDLLADMQEAVLWAKGEKALKSTTLSDNKEQKAVSSFAPRPSIAETQKPK